MASQRILELIILVDTSLVFSNIDGGQQFSTLVTGSLYLVSIAMPQEVAVPCKFSATVFDLTLYLGVLMDESSVVH